MLDPYLDYIWAAFAAIIAAVWGFAKWYGGRMVAKHDELQKRVDDIEINFVPRQEFNETVKSLRQEVHEGNRITHDRLDKIMILMVGGKKPD